MELTITQPDDWHLHLRDGELLQAVVPHSASFFGRAIVMPNLKPPITSTAAAVAYRESILKALPADSDFSPLMTLYLTDTTSPREIKLARESGVVFAVKLYPAGATTNSQDGVTDLFGKCLPVLEEMAEQNMPLLVHGEVTDPNVDVFDREKVFIDTILQPLIQRLPQLKVVMEHITTMEAVRFVESCSHGSVAATVTPQHLLLNRNAIFQGGLQPHNYCLPVLKREIHRQAIVSAVTSGNKKFFLGTDSAPHEKRRKECPCGCAGIYNAPVAISLYAKVFEEAGALDKLEAFTSFNGPDFTFLLYYFLSQVAMEENMASSAAVMLLEGLEEFATEKWQKALALHQLGCVMLERKEYKGAQFYFEAAVEAGHVYSLAGVARTKYKQGQQYSAFRLMNSLIFKHKPVGWMYQERSLYGVGQEKIMDMNTATELDPTLSFPYKFRAVMKVEEKQIRAAITEIDKIIGFKLSPDCLELRAWFFIALEDFESALRDIRALLTLEPKYMMFHGRVSGDHLVELLSHRIRLWSLADCWMQLYERWSSVDDIGSLAVLHQMLSNDPAKSLLWFRQSLLLLRLNCQKAAMRCLRLARNHTSSVHERLIYEGWLLFDSGHREEALSRAEKSISIQRSFEAFFLMAYTLADTNLDPESSSTVIQLLEEALRCPSDGLRKGQALNNLGSIYVDCGKLDQAADCYMNALNIKHTRAHQGLARVYHLKNQRKAAFDEMTKLIEKAHSSASAYEKRSEYCDREKAKDDLNMATQLDPLRTYPYRYRAAVLMDGQKETEALEELTKAIAFKPELQMLHLRAAFYESMGDKTSARQDCEAALCLDQNHTDTLNLYNRTQDQATRSI